MIARLKPEQKATFLYLHKKFELTQGSILTIYVTHGLTSITWISILLTLAIQMKGTFLEFCYGNVELKNCPKISSNDKEGDKFAYSIISHFKLILLFLKSLDQCHLLVWVAEYFMDLTLYTWLSCKSRTWKCKLFESDTFVSEVQEINYSRTKCYSMGHICEEHCKQLQQQNWAL